MLLALATSYAFEPLKEEYESGEIANELWKLSVDVPDGKLVLMTVTVTGNPYVDTQKSEGKGMQVKRFERIVHTPSRSYSELVQHKGAWTKSEGDDGAGSYSSTVLGFGQAIAIEDLVRSGGGSGEMKTDQSTPGETYSSRVRFNFVKAFDDSSDRFEVRFRMSSFSVSYFEERLKGTRIEMPKMEDEAWALPLAPVVEVVSDGASVSEFTAVE